MNTIEVSNGYNRTMHIVVEYFRASQYPHFAIESEELFTIYGYNGYNLS
jgi:hypothetical protein